MIKIKRTNLTPAELAKIDNLNANADMNLEHDTYGKNVVKNLRDENITLCHELAVHRELLKLLSDKVGVTLESFDELNKKVNEAKEKAREENIEGN